MREALNRQTRPMPRFRANPDAEDEPEPKRNPGFEQDNAPISSNPATSGASSRSEGRDAAQLRKEFGEKSSPFPPQIAWGF